MPVSDFRPPDPHVKRALAAMADMRFLKAHHQRAKFGRPSHCGTWRRSTPRSDSAPILPLPVMTSTKVRPSLWARCRKPDSARWARVCVMPWRSSRASISFRPRDNCERSRRPIGASGGGSGFGAARNFGRHGVASAMPRAFAAGASGRPRGPLRRELFPQRFRLFGDALPQRALLLAQAAFAARRGRQFRDRGRGGVSSAAAIIDDRRWRRASRTGSMFGPRLPAAARRCFGSAGEAAPRCCGRRRLSAPQLCAGSVVL